MGSNDSCSFPLIDFSDLDLNPGTPKWNLVKSQVLKAATEYGCFQALFNKMPEELQKAMSGTMEELFQLPSEAKKCNVSEKPFHGYLGSASATSPYESFGVDGPDNYKKVENFINALWPEGNIKHSKTLHSFSEPLVELDQKVRRMLLEGLCVDKHLDEHINSTCYFLRIANYRATHTVKKPALRSHADKNIITIFYQNQGDGLEMQTKDGDWIPLKFSPNSFYIAVGESLKAWTNGRLYSPNHRVMMAKNSTRYSAVLCSVPKEGYVIKALEELVDADHPLLFKPFKYSEYLKRRLADFDKTLPLKDYFGV